jgi:hypothetical protein
MTNSTLLTLDLSDLLLVTGGNGDNPPQPRPRFDVWRTVRAAGVGCAVGAVPGAIIGGITGSLAGGVGAVPGALAGAGTGCVRGAFTGAGTDIARQTGLLP